MKIFFNIPYLPKEPIFLFRKHGNPENIAVKSNMRGLNIGTGLVNSALEWFKKTVLIRSQLLHKGKIFRPKNYTKNAVSERIQ